MSTSRAKKGAGHVEVRSNSIRLHFILNGRRQKETLALKPTPKNLDHANRFLINITREIERGTFEYAVWFPNSPTAKEQLPVATPFGEICDVWLESKGRLAAATKAQYRNALGFWKEQLGENKAIDSITHAKIVAAVGRHPWPSAKLCNNYLIPLRGVFKLACRTNKGLEDPMEGVENSKHQKAIPDPLSVADMEKLLSYMREMFPRSVVNYFTIAFLTGLRPEELIALEWSDIDWKQKTITVQRAKTFKGGLKQIKTAETRHVDLVSRAVDALLDQQKIKLTTHPEVFYHPATGRPWHDERAQRDTYWKPALKACRIRPRRAYQTRHTYATTALMAGVNPAYIAKQLGHANANMLFRVYAKWIYAADNGRERAKLEIVLAQNGPPNLAI